MRRLLQIVKINLLFLALVPIARAQTFPVVQPPNISYPTPQIYPVNKTIASLAPTNMAGVVPAAIYGQISTLAGSGSPGAVNGSGLSASFSYPIAITTDGVGNFYVAELDNALIRKITPGGVTSTVAGMVKKNGYADGPGNAALFNKPSGIVADAAGNLYVADAGNNRIRKISPAGLVSTYAGNGQQGSANGSALQSSFNYPSALAMDAAGNLFIVDENNNLIRLVSSAGIVSTFAGNFNDPKGITIDKDGNLYVTDQNSIHVITPAGVVSTLAGGNNPGSADGQGSQASFNQPYGIAVSPAGDLYVADSGNDRIRKITLQGKVTTVAGDVPGAGINDKNFHQPTGIVIDASGNAYITESGGGLNAFGSNIITQLILTGYKIDKNLPPGLTFASKTGMISGTPTAPSPPTDYMVTAYNAGGSNTATVNITVTALTPTIITGPVTGIISACLGSPSASPDLQQFSVSGTGLTGNITATGPAGFEISLSSSSGYGNSVTINQTGGTVNNAIIYVRSAASATGSISGNITLSSPGATSQNVAVKGTVNSLPTADPVANQIVLAGKTTTAINFTGSGNTFTWTNNTPGIGLPANGIGNISSFTAVNNGTTPVTATITATPAQARLAYVPNFNSNTVSVINTLTNTVVATIPVDLHPYGVALTADGSTAYVTNTATGYVSVINTIADTVITNIKVGSFPSGLSLSPDGKFLFVAITDDNTVTIINTATNQVLANQLVGRTPEQTVVNNDGTRVYVTCKSFNNVSVVNTVTHQNLQSINVGTSPEGIAITPDGNYLYVANNGSNTVSVISTSINLVATTINVGAGPQGVAVSPDGSTVYVTNTNDNTVSVISTATNTVTGTINAGPKPYGVSVDSDDGYVYVANYGSNTVTVIDAKTNIVVKTVTVGNAPVAMGNFISNGTGCTGAPITFTITVNPLLPPAITAPDTLYSLSTIYGTPSVSDSFLLAATNLQSPVTITPPPGFEVSGDDYFYSNTLMIGGIGNLAATPIYVRLAGTTPVGTYSGNIVLSSTGANDVNVYIPNSTVLPAPLTITADNKTRPFNTPNPPLTVTYNGFQNQDGPAQLTTQPIITTTATLSSPIGDYPITVSGASSPNYDIFYVGGTLSIVPSPSSIKIPNAFTPNGDGVNDVWNILELSSYPQCTVSVYSRSGSLVYQSHGYPVPWDGTMNGNPLPTGTYYYIISPQNDLPKFSGYVAILR